MAFKSSKGRDVGKEIETYQSNKTVLGINAGEGSGGDVPPAEISNILTPSLPPFTSKTGPAVNLSNSDGKIEFSLDDVTYSSTLSVPAETVFYCNWTNDILSASHGSNYSTTIGVSYPNLSTPDEDVDISITIDKKPEPFSFTDPVDVVGDAVIESNAISPLFTINAPASVWGSTTSNDADMAIGDGAWESIPSAPNTRYVNQNERIRLRHRTLSGALTQTSTTLNIGYGTLTGQFETDDFVTTNINSYVEQPTITDPTDGGVSNSLTPTLTASAFTSVGSLVHASTDWQIATDSAFTSVVWESLADSSNLESVTATTLGLGVYYARVRYRDTFGAVSNYSPTVEFNTPFAAGSNVSVTTATNAEIDDDTTVTLQAGSYRIYLWGGGGGAAAGGSRGPSSGGGAGMVYKDVTYSSVTNVAITIGDGGGGGTENSSNQFGAGGVPGGGNGLGGPGAFFAGGGGGGRSVISPLNITAAGGGGGGGDALAIGPGGPGGSSPGGAGGRIQSNSGGGSNPAPGFTIPGSNYSANSGNNISGTFSGSGSFSNMQGTSINVTLRASGPAGTVEDTINGVTGSWNGSVNHGPGYGNYNLIYNWNGNGSSGVNHSYNVSYNGTGDNGPRGTAGSSGGGGGGGGSPTNSDGGSGGQGGSNSGSFDGQASASGTNAGSRYFSTAFSRYFGDGGTGTSAGQRGGARIVKTA